MHPHDRPDMLLVELLTIEMHRDREDPLRCQAQREWVASDQLVIHRKQLHVKHRGHLYKVGRTAQPSCGLTGIDYWSATRWIEEKAERTASAP